MELALYVINAFILKILTTQQSFLKFQNIIEISTIISFFKFFSDFNENCKT